MNPATPFIPKSELAALARLTIREVARWTFGCMALAVVLKLAIVGVGVLVTWVASGLS